MFHLCAWVSHQIPWFCRRMKTLKDTPWYIATSHPNGGGGGKSQGPLLSLFKPIPQRWCTTCQFNANRKKKPGTLHVYTEDVIDIGMKIFGRIVSQQRSIWLLWQVHIVLDQRTPCCCSGCSWIQCYHGSFVAGTQENNSSRMKTWWIGRLEPEGR